MIKRVLESEFIFSFGSITEVDLPTLPEVALIGRSNAGKSTLLNNLCGRKQLAKVSGKPGKTRTINYFKLRLELDNGEQTEIYVVDLPGYGYAKTGKKQRFSMQTLVVDYFEQRESLDLVYLLSDSKRTLNEEDAELYQFIRECGPAINIVLTKMDKINQKEKNASLKKNANKINLLPEDLLKSGSNMSLQPLLDRISVLL